MVFGSQPALAATESVMASVIQVLLLIQRICIKRATLAYSF